MMSKELKLTIFLVGFNAVIVQTVLIRELAQVFFGTELLIGLGFAFWLLWGALGAAVFRVKMEQRAMAWFLGLLIASALLFTGQVLLIRAIRVITGSPAGMLLGMGQLALFSLLAIAPTAFANGALFALALSLAQRDAKAFSLVYRWDVWGGFAGGLLGALLLIPTAPVFLIAQAVGLLYLVPALLLLLRARRIAMTVTSLGCLIACGLFVFIPLETITIGWLFPGQNVVAAGVSKYSQLAVVHNADQHSLYENGQLAAVWPDGIGAEERCLIPLSLLRRTQRVLLIGGVADLAEFASLPGVRTTYLEIDRKAWDLFYPFIGEASQRLISSNTVSVEFTDFRAYVNHYQGPKYDLVLVDLPDPYNAGVNRGYTREFFAGLRAILADSGVARLSVASNENYLSPALRGFGASILKTVSACFARTALVSGDRLVILASPANTLVIHPDSVMARLRRQGIVPQYLSNSYLASKILPDRIEFIREQLDKTSAPQNLDLRPVGYAYQLRLSAQMLKDHAIGVLLDRALRARWQFLLLLALPFLLPLFKRGLVPPCAALVTGFAGMVALMAALLAFQALHGYVYHLVALVSACYLAGLALGGALPAPADDARRSPLLPLSGLAAVLLVLIPLSAARLPALPQTLAFCAMAAAAGVGGGWALAALVQRSPRPAGVLYAFDLAGGALGGACFALWWLPAYGQTAALLAAAGLVIPVILLILPLTSHGN